MYGIANILTMKLDMPEVLLKQEDYGNIEKFEAERQTALEDGRKDIAELLDIR